MSPLEKEIEDKFCEYAREKGCEPIKFKDPSRRDAPDRMVLCPGGRTIFFEFKRPGEKPRYGQLQYHRALENLGFFVCVESDLVRAKYSLDYFLDEI
jgi:hypothetical protein